MGLFSKKEERYIGVDIGAGGVKLIELLFEGGVYKLMTYGSTQRSASVAEQPITDDVGEATAHVKRLMRDAGVKATKAVASLPVHAVFSSMIAIPHVKDPLETRKLVERQAEKLMPVPLAEMVIDFQFVDGKTAQQSERSEQKQSERVQGAGRAQENVRVLITGAKRSMIETYTSVFRGAGLDLVSLETESFALIRALVGGDKSPIMMLDVGSYRTNMTIVEEGVPFLTRSIKVGGALVTRTMAEQLSVDVEEAEQMKYDLARSGEHGVPKAVQELFQPIVNEIAYAMRLYAESDVTDHRRVEKIILTGGSAHLPGLDLFLTEKLNARTMVGDPWARVQVNEAMRSLLEDIGPRFSVAIGLAMHAKTLVKEPKKAEKKAGA